MVDYKKTPVRRVKKDTPAEPLSKAELAKKKVEELLEGVKLTKEDKTVVVDRLEAATKDNSVEWLENQIAGLTEQNEKLQADYAKLLNDYKLKGGAPVGEAADLKRGIEKIFFELDEVYTGAKFGKPFEEAKIRPLLNKFMSTFPFLGESLKRKKTVTQTPRAQNLQTY